MSHTPHLDPHCLAIVQEYKDRLPEFEEAEGKVLALLNQTLNEAGIHLASIESRIKTKPSLEGKLER